MLDLGCGYGFWCIQAAGFFQNCRVVGLDIADIQPSLQRLGYPELSNKISWVHGDMLERLPFPDNHFDFVRTMHTEYCVPEHKEVSRVLKPGGIFESIQEALIFPCPRFSPRIRPPKNVAAVAELSVDESPSAQFSISKEVADTDPRDHSRLKAAFDAMVEVRFLNPQIISTLPFYMELQFDIVNMTSIFHVMLPPSSFVRDRDDPTSGAATEPKGLAEQQINVRGMLQMEPHASSQEVISDQGGEMHLNHTLNTILSCKEAIREQFEVLNPTLKRIDFDFLMKNWELDMRDRIDMRTLLREGLLWDCPTDNGDPEERFWREETLRFHQEDGLWDAQPIPQPCRSIRAYRGIKRR
ncbi:hypothetical protein K439DRAFT_1623790 [Ramaria rubella]|nr:hypothetical protein K439DRAFT_1623790 [Ramaria rubella]